MAEEKIDLSAPLVKDAGALAAFLDDCGGVLALDTEFVWERTYYPRLGVVQLNTAYEHPFLIDAVALDDWTPLRRVIEDSACVKVLHDAQQDLTILHQVCGAVPRTIFDTRLAAGFTGRDSTIGLSGLLSQLFGVELSKEATRSDWLRRPLSDKQLSYAINDVRYLPEAWRCLRRECRERGNDAYCREEMGRYDGPALYGERPLREMGDRVKGAKRLGGTQRRIVQAVAAWRERTARQRNRPRGHVISDRAVMAIGAAGPETEADLKAVSALSDAARRRYGEALLRAVAAGAGAADDSVSDGRTNVHFDRLKGEADAILKSIRTVCGQRSIDAALVCSRQRVNRFLAAEEDSLLFSGWRADMMGPEFARQCAAARRRLTEDD